MTPNFDELSFTASHETTAPEAASFSAGQRGHVTRSETIVASAVLVLAGAVILAHLILVRNGGWGGDEYFNFAIFKRDGIAWVFARLLHWSPRPLSDGMLYLYSLAVGYWRTPLIAPYLAVLWAGLIGGTIAAAWQRGSSGLLPRLTLALSILAMFLLGHGINDLFYWPMGATPYLLDLLGITVVTLQAIAGGTLQPGGRLAAGVALAAAAASSETGLFFSLAFTSMLLLLEWPEMARSGLSGLKGREWYLAPLLLSLAAAGCLWYIIVTNQARGMDQASGYYHHFGASLIATLLGVVPDMFRSDGSSGGLESTTALATDCLLFLGFLWACRAGFMRKAAPRHMAALLAGLAGCFVTTIFTSYYEYGQWVHEPQTAFRKCLVVLGLVAAARLVEPHWPERWPLLRRLGPIALIGAIGIGMLARLPGLIDDYGLHRAIVEARALSWQSGLDPTRTTLRYVVPPQAQVVNGLLPGPPGRFDLGGAGTDWWMTGLMEFFGKRSLEFAPLPATAGNSR